MLVNCEIPLQQQTAHNNSIHVKIFHCFIQIWRCWSFMCVIQNIFLYSPLVPQVLAGQLFQQNELFTQCMLEGKLLSLSCFHLIQTWQKGSLFCTWHQEHCTLLYFLWPIHFPHFNCFLPPSESCLPLKICSHVKQAIHCDAWPVLAQNYDIGVMWYCLKDIEHL